MDALLLAVLNALWQGAVLIGLVALGLRAGLRRNATTACVVWTITFAVVALLPAIDLVVARPAGVPARRTDRGGREELITSPFPTRAARRRSRRHPPS